MKKKISLTLIFLFVVWLAIGYYFAQREERGRMLVANAYYGNLLAVKNDVESGAPLEYEFFFQDDERQYTSVWFNALHAAASSGDEDVINFLLDQGFNIDTRTPDGWTPLFIATRDGRAEAAKLLIYRGADLNAASKQGATPLLMVLTQPFPTQKERVELLQYLLRRGANTNQADEHGFSPLYYAIISGQPETVELLLEYDADPLAPAVQKAQDYLQTSSVSQPQIQKITALLTKAVKKAKIKSTK